ncbi:hypothetical protein PoB_007419100 [Plakobranchus ocellatus]|uniref:Uncharacterized protein n=1 Tax=Plakobranchus ocellatus TaxID=259542 RepID=A0AAV4DV28_9GAST|nr:hypothetical protein PoB_007419100 [Plakobranchus ocellatus]
MKDSAHLVYLSAKTTRAFPNMMAAMNVVIQTAAFCIIPALVVAVLQALGVMTVEDNSRFCCNRRSKEGRRWSRTCRRRVRRTRSYGCKVSRGEQGGLAALILEPPPSPPWLLGIFTQS